MTPTVNALLSGKEESWPRPLARGGMVGPSLSQRGSDRLTVVFLHMGRACAGGGGTAQLPLSHVSQWSPDRLVKQSTIVAVVG